MRPSSTRAFVVGIVGLSFVLVHVLVILSSFKWDPTILLAQGDKAPREASYAERLLGRDVLKRPILGHDGRFFFAQANDPWYLEPSLHAVVLDLPVYRAQRMLYPTIAGGFGILPPNAVVWTLVGVNVLAVGIGTWATAMVAMAMGASRWVGLAFALNPGVLAEVDIDGGGALALALGMAGILCLMSDRVALSSITLAGAVLARELMILFVFGAIFGYWLQYRRLRIVPLVVGVACAFVWRLYVLQRLADLQLETLGDFPENALTMQPFAGPVAAIPIWLESRAKLGLIVALVAMMVMFLVRGVTSRTPVAWASMPFLVLATFSAVVVWREPYDLARAVAPVFTAYPLLLFQRPMTEHVFE